MNYLRFFILTLAAAIITRPVQAQTKAVAMKGIVTDSLTGVVLEQTSILLLRLPGGRPFSQTVSGKNGFILRRIPPGNYLLISSFIGYKTDTLSLTVGDRDSSSLNLRVRMQAAGTDLMEVVVKAKIPPMTIRHDTLVYNADAYKTRPNATVEDLLKQLPGVEVDENGNVTVQGKSVEKIYIDGKLFFLNDPRILTQNLTADMVEQVEAMDAQSDKAKLTGIPDPNPNKVLNLVLKKDKKPGFLGHVEGGYGTEKTRSAAGQIMRFEHAPEFFANFSTSSNTLLGSTTGNLMCSGKIGDKITATVNYTYLKSRNIQSQSSLQETFLGDSTLSQKSSLQSGSKNGANILSSSIVWNIDSLSAFSLTPAVNNFTSTNNSLDSQAVAVGKTTGSYTSSQGVTGNTSSSNSYILNSGLTFTHRFRKKGRTFLATLNTGYTGQPQNGAIHSVLNSYDSAQAMIKDSTVNQQSTQNTGMHTYGVNMTYTEPVSARQLIVLSYAFNYTGNNTDRNSYDYDPVTGKYDLPDSLTTNNFTNTATTQRVNIGYDINSGKIQYQMGTGVQFSRMLNNDITGNIDLKQAVTNWYPRASFMYDISKGKSISMHYSGNGQSPSISQLQPLPNLSNPLLVNIGNPNLYPQFTHSVDVNYQSFSTEHFTTFLAQASGNYVLDKISPSTTVLSSGVQQIQYINVNGAYSFNGHMTYGFPLGGVKFGNGMINSSAMYNRNVSMVNGAEDRTATLGFTQDLSLNFHFRDKLFVEGKAGVSYNNMQNSIQEGSNAKMLSQKYDFSISYVLPFFFKLATDCHWQITGARGSLPGNQQVLWNASLSRNIFRNKRGEIKLSGMDLLNASSGYSQSSGANSIQATSTKIVGRVFQAGFLYRFMK